MKHALQVSAVLGDGEALAREPGCLLAMLQGYLAHKKQQPPLGPPYDPR